MSFSSAVSVRMLHMVTFLFLLLVLGLQQADAVFESKVFDDCWQSGNGRILCIGSKGQETSLPHQSDGCFANKDCSLVVQGERLFQPHGGVSYDKPISWQIWSLRDSEAPQTIHFGLNDQPIGHKDGIQGPQSLRTGTMFVDLSVRAQSRESEEQLKHLQAFCTVGTDAQRLTIVEQKKNFWLPSSDPPVEGQISVDEGVDKKWNYFRIITPRKLVHHRRGSIRVNIDVGSRAASFSIWARRQVQGSLSPDGLISGQHFKFWFEKSAGVAGDNVTKDPDDASLPVQSVTSDDTGMWIAIAIGFFVILVIIVAGVMFFFLIKRARRRRRERESQLSSLSYVPSTKSGRLTPPPASIISGKPVSLVKPVPSDKSSKVASVSSKLPASLASRKIPARH